MARVSVIIPTYNRAQYIAQAVDSVLAQSYKDYEIVIVDDGSTDNTREVIEGYSTVRYIAQSNRGEAGARNTGIRNTTGEYLAFLDADDTFLPAMLETQVALLESDPDVAVAYSDVNLSDERGQVRGRLSSVIPGGKVSGHVFEALVRGNFLTVNSVLVRRAVLKRVGLFEETIRTFPDWDLWLRIAAEYPFLYQDVPLANYRMHSQMVSQDRVRMWQGALAVRTRIITWPAFQACSPPSRQYCYYQLGLLNCLVGDMRKGRSYLWRAMRSTPVIPTAGLALGLGLPGRQLLRAVVSWRAAHNEWLKL